MNSKFAATFAVGSALGALGAIVAIRASRFKTTKALPKLYVYDHCPFCVRARMIFGLKNIKYELIFLANADEATPIGLVGAKQAPILDPIYGKPFPESMDIVRFVDTKYGSHPILKESANREDIRNWIKDTAQVFRLLYHPRFHLAPFAEFAQFESREYYRIKKEKTIGPFQDAIAKTPDLVKEANEMLEKLSDMFHSSNYVNHELSYDDIDLFGRLRGLTLVKDLKWPPKLRKYMEKMSKAADIPLLDVMAKY